MGPRKKVVILTGSELRHEFFRKKLAASGPVEVLRSYCEGTEKSLGALVGKESANLLRWKHLRAREQSEEDFFRLFVDAVEDRSAPVNVAKGQINEPAVAEAILGLQADLVVAYGCSIVREKLLDGYRGRIVNIHLGLSPYYRGSGTNYWPLVNGEPEYVGVTFMHMDAGVDTGAIIHQIPARIAPGDTPVQLGNRLIVAMTETCGRLLACYDRLESMKQPAPTPSDRYYRKKDYTEESVAQLYQNMHRGMIDEFLRDETERRARVPLVRNPVLDHPA